MMQDFRRFVFGSLAVLLTGCTAPNPSGLTGAFSFAADPLSPPKGYERLMSPAPHNFRRAGIETGDPVRRGLVSERFELRDGDCAESDCGNPRSRAEIQMDKRINRSAIGKDIWYGWSFYNATVPPFQKENSLRLVFGQWTMGGKNKPIFRFIQLGKGEQDFDGCDPRICNTRNPSKGDLAVELQDIAHAQGWGEAQNNGYVCRLFDLHEARGQWMDMVVNTNFSAGNDGYLRIWVNQELVCNYSGPLVSRNSLAADGKPRHRRGIYSSWTGRWEKLYGDAPKPRLVVYYDEFRVGRRLSDVDVRYHTESNVPPVD